MRMDAKSVRNMQSIIAVTNKHTAKLHHVGSLYILTYDARKLKHKITQDIHFYENGKYGDCAKYFNSVPLSIYGLLSDAYSASGSIALNAETTSKQRTKYVLFPCNKEQTNKCTFLYNKTNQMH